MLVAPEVASLLAAPVLGGPARAFCGALQTPDVHGTTLRDTLTTLVREATMQAMPLGDLRRVLSLMVRDCSRAPAHDRAGIAEYVVRRVEMLYDEADFGLGVSPVSSAPAAPPLGSSGAAPRDSSANRLAPP